MILVLLGVGSCTKEGDTRDSREPEVDESSLANSDAPESELGSINGVVDGDEGTNPSLTFVGVFSVDDEGKRNDFVDEIPVVGGRYEADLTPGCYLILLVTAEDVRTDAGKRVLENLACVSSDEAVDVPTVILTSCGGLEERCPDRLVTLLLNAETCDQLTEVMLGQIDGNAEYWVSLSGDLPEWRAAAERQLFELDCPIPDL